MKSPNKYALGRIDRVGHLRTDEIWVRERLSDQTTRIYPMWRSRCLVMDGDLPQALAVPPDEAMLAAAEGVTFLGTVDGVAHFALDLSHHEAPPVQSEGAFLDLRAVGPRMAEDEASVLAYGRAMTTWHQRHLHCSVCGSRTVSKQAGHVRQCTNENCNAQCFPRTDPAVIMLIHDGGDRLVLGRQSRWPSGQRSVLAGFVEPGESLEDAVAREVFEEVGLRIADVTYHSSQPWPFPANIMLGFTARAVTFDIQVNTDELEGAWWFTRDQVRNSPENDEFRLPRRDSISRRLIEEWAAGECG